MVPALRLGYMIVPKPLINVLVRARQPLDKQERNDGGRRKECGVVVESLMIELREGVIFPACKHDKNRRHEDLRWAARHA
jgi:hypothetical protein